MYSTRPANNDDYPVLLDYGKNFAVEAKWVDEIGYDRESVIPWLDLCQQSGLLFLLESDGEAVGMAGGIVSAFFFNKNVLQGAELFWWIRPEHRNGGAGKLLMNTLENAARDRGVSKWSMVALASLEPEKAGAIYERCGYKLSELSYTRTL
jgi:GNAT superfamily N-acetyltransferase